MGQKGVFEGDFPLPRFAPTFPGCRRAGAALGKGGINPGDVWDVLKGDLETTAVIWPKIGNNSARSRSRSRSWRGGSHPDGFFPIPVFPARHLPGCSRRNTTFTGITAPKDNSCTTGSRNFPPGSGSGWAGNVLNIDGLLFKNYYFQSYYLIYLFLLFRGSSSSLPFTRCLWVPVEIQKSSRNPKKSSLNPKIPS